MAGQQGSGRGNALTGVELHPANAASCARLAGDADWCRAKLTGLQERIRVAKRSQGVPLSVPYERYQQAIAALGRGLQAQVRISPTAPSAPESL